MKRIRLPLDAYSQSHVWHLALHAAAGIAPFGDATLVRDSLNSLELATKKYGVRIYAYCFMPDHLHLLAHNERGDDLIQFVRQFKQLTAFAFKQKTGSQLWQARFYDRALRSDDDLKDVVNYIIGNPVTAGLAATPEAFAFSGSFEWSLFRD